MLSFLTSDVNLVMEQMGFKIESARHRIRDDAVK